MTAVGLLPRSGPEPPKPLALPQCDSDKVAFCYTREVTLGLHSRVGAGCQNQPGDWRGRTFRPPDL